MDSWRKVWRAGVQFLSTPGLEALQKALEEDSPLLLQGCTTIPPPLACVQDWPVEGSCLIGYCYVIDFGGFHVATIGEVEEAWARWCYDVDNELGEPGAIRWLLNWWDDSPREEVLKLLLPEVKKTLANRRVGQLSNSGVDVDVYPIAGVDTAT